MRNFDALVLGGGAAGLLCAIEAGKRGRRVAVLEYADRIGKKILISGGGRCNFTNIHCQPENFISANEHFAKSALARYTPADFIALVEKHRIPYHEKTLGQLFCDRSAEDITELLESECREAGVQIFLQSRIQEVQRTTDFVVRTESGEFCAPALVIATGGLSIPKMGATPFGYELARQFGLKIVGTKPALVPFVLAGKDRSRYLRLGGRFSRSGRAGQSSRLPREDADHSSRLERARDTANFLVLGEGAADSNRPGSGSRDYRSDSRRKGAQYDSGTNGFSGNSAEAIR